MFSLSSFLFVSFGHKAPVIFLRLAEIEEGENDLVLQPGSWTGFPFLNYTSIRLVEALTRRQRTFKACPQKT